MLNKRVYYEEDGVCKHGILTDITPTHYVIDNIKLIPIWKDVKPMIQ